MSFLSDMITEFVEKLCALVPLPRMHLVRYSGVLAPNARMRRGVIPGKTRAQIKAEQEEKNKDQTEKPTLLQKSSWAKLLAKVFDIDISKCSCGGNLKIISVIRDPKAFDTRRRRKEKPSFNIFKKDQLLPK